MAILQSMITQINNKIERLLQVTKKITELPPINTSNCLVCESTRLKIIATKRKKDGFHYRIATCLECGSINKQAIESISVKKSENVFTASNEKIAKMVEPFVLTVINGKVTMELSNHNTVLNRIYNKVAPELRDYIITKFQKDYDDGKFEYATKNIDPVSIRFIHNHDINLGLTRMFVRYLGLKTKHIIKLKAVTNYRVHCKQINESTKNYYMNIKNISFVVRREKK